MIPDRIDELIEIAAGITRGQLPAFQHNECFTAGAFDLLLINVRDSEAFNLLSELCRRFDSANTSQPSVGYYNLLTQVAHQTNTTEMPAGMSEIIGKHPELSQELRAWYRISG